LIRVDTLAAGQLTAIENSRVTRIRSDIFAPSNGPCREIICIPLPTHAPCGDRGHGGRIVEPNKAGTAHLPWVGSLAALKLSTKEICGIVWIRSSILASSMGPRRYIISVPLTGIGVVKRVVKLANADARDLTSKGFIAAFQLGFIAGRVAVRLVITTRNIPSGLIIRVPHFWGTRRAPG
jgi:hypothetical protein